MIYGNQIFSSDIFIFNEFRYFVWTENYLYRTSFKRRKINLITKFPVPGLPPPPCRDLLLCPGKTAFFQVSRKLKSLLIWEMGKEKVWLILSDNETEILSTMSQQELLNVVKRYKVISSMNHTKYIMNETISDFLHNWSRRCCSTEEPLGRPDFYTLRLAVKNLSE